MTDIEKNQQKIIFVTGASRSGTTMLNRILGQNTEVLGFNELHLFGDLITPANMNHRIDDEEQIKLVATMLIRVKHGIWNNENMDNYINESNDIIHSIQPDSRTAATLFEQTCKYLAQKQNKSSVCEQTPRNIFYAEKLLSTFEHAYIVHLVRDPRSVLASQKNKWRRRFLGGSNIPKIEVVRTWFNYHPITLSKLWVKATQTAVNLEQHPRLFLLQFETLLDDPEKHISELCEFLDINYEDEMLNIPQVGSSHKPNMEASRGISKQLSGDWSSSLSIGEITICEKISSRLMKRFNYSLQYENSTPIMTLVKPLLRYPVHLVGVIFTNPRRALIQLKAFFS